MTNTTPSQRLALARAVYGKAACVGTVYCLFDGELCREKDDVVRIRSGAPGGWSDFLPESNPEQLLDVLCWLLRQDNCNEVDCDVIRFYSDKHDHFLNEEHNCTPASLSDAVVRAAVRVREGE